MSVPRYKAKFDQTDFQIHVNITFETVSAPNNPTSPVYIWDMRINKRKITKSDDDSRKRKTDNDLRICTWHVRNLNWDDASIQLIDILDRYKADITAIQ